MLYKRFNISIDGQDGCGKTSIFHSLERLYHEIPSDIGLINLEEERDSDIIFLTSRPKDEEAVNKEEAEATAKDFRSNMYKYMDAYIKDRLNFTSKGTYRFFSDNIRKPIVTINDRGLLSTFFYAYVFIKDKNIANNIISLNKKTNDLAKRIANNRYHKANKEQNQEAEKLIKMREYYSDELFQSYISFEREIEKRVICIIHRNSENYESMEFIDIISSLRNDITFAIQSVNEIREDVIKKRNENMTAESNDDKIEYKDIFEGSFRDQVNAVYDFFFQNTFYKIDKCGYINPYIGELKMVCTSGYYGDEAKWRPLEETLLEIRDTINDKLERNAYSRMILNGYEKHRCVYDCTF